MGKSFAKLRSRSAYTLIEALLSASIVALLAAVAVPASTASLERSRVQTDASLEQAAYLAGITEYKNAGTFGGGLLEETEARYFDPARGIWVESESGSKVPLGITGYGECVSTNHHDNLILAGEMEAVSGQPPHLVLSWTDGNGHTVLDLCGDPVPPKPDPLIDGGEGSSVPESSEQESSIVVPTFTGSAISYFERDAIPIIRDRVKPACGAGYECWYVTGYVGQTVDFPNSGVVIDRLTKLVNNDYSEETWLVRDSDNIRGQQWREENEAEWKPWNDGMNLTKIGGINYFSATGGNTTPARLRYTYRYKGEAQDTTLCLHYSPTSTTYEITTDPLILRAAGSSTPPGGYNTPGDPAPYPGAYPTGIPTSTGTILSGPRLRSAPPCIALRNYPEFEAFSSNTSVATVEDGIGAVDMGDKTISWTIQAKPVTTYSTAIITCVYQFVLRYPPTPNSRIANNIVFKVTVKTEVRVYP